jgi:hypothetical protein
MNDITPMKTCIEVAHVHLFANQYCCNKPFWNKSQLVAKEEKDYIV